MNKTFTEMDDEEFDGLIDGYIERTAHGEMPVEVYFDLLTERMEEQIEEALTPSIEYQSVPPNGLKKTTATQSPADS